jgi:hypothetical protein
MHSAASGRHSFPTRVARRGRYAVKHCDRQRQLSRQTLQPNHPPAFAAGHPALQTPLETVPLASLVPRLGQRRGGVLAATLQVSLWELGESVCCFISIKVGQLKESVWFCQRHIEGQQHMGLATCQTRWRARPHRCGLTTACSNCSRSTEALGQYPVPGSGIGLQVSARVSC